LNSAFAACKPTGLKNKKKYPWDDLGLTFPKQSTLGHKNLAPGRVHSGAQFPPLVDGAQGFPGGRDMRKGFPATWTFSGVDRFFQLIKNVFFPPECAFFKFWED